MVLTLTFILSLLFPAGAFAGATAAFTIGLNRYVVDGQTKIMDVAPYIKDGRTYLPIRYAAQAAGIGEDAVIWNSREKSVVLVKDGRAVKMSIGSKILLINGTSITMDAAPEIVNGRTMLPLRWLTQSLGIPVYWDEKTQTVSLGEQSPQGRIIQPLEYKNGITTVSRDFTWQYNKIPYSWHIQVPVSLDDWNRKVNQSVSEFYRDKAKQTLLYYSMDKKLKELVLAYSTNSNGNFTPWVTEENNYEFTGYLGKRLALRAQADGFSRFQQAEFALSFVGDSITYKEDTSYQLPALTLVDNGDCDCKSILLAAILKNMGYNVALLSFPSHMAVGIAFSSDELPPGREMSFYENNGIKYYFAETSSSGWSIGRLSDESLEKKSTVYPI